jgi:predicted nucleotidyltransferase
VTGDDAVERARVWAERFAARFSEALEVWLVGSRAAGRAVADSDHDFIVLVDGTGTLLVSAYDTTPSWETAWGWLLPEDAAALRFTPAGVTCDLMLVDASAEEVRAVGGVIFAASDPHVLLWRRRTP